MGDRTCGGCTVCCKIVAVDELQKPPWKQCGFCSGKVCEVYDTGHMPTSCKSFECLWLQRPDLLPIDAQRPDRLGIMFSIGDTGRLLITEAWAGGFNGPNVFRSVQAITKALGPFDEKPLAIGNALHMTDEEKDRTICQCDCHAGPTVVQHKTACCWKCPACTLNIKHEYAQDHRREHEKDEKETRG